MANPLPEEKQFYERIKNEKIVISPDIWDLFYHHIGDGLTAINLLCQYYLKENQPIPVLEAKKIIIYTRHIKDIAGKITLSSKSDDFLFPEFLDSVPLHPILREMITHYIGNDIYMINLIVEDSIDPLEPQDISLELIQKILRHTHAIREFMERLRIATLREGKSAEPGETRKNNRQPTKEEIFLRIRKCLTEELKFSNQEKIQINSRFQEDLGLDSVDALRVVMALEEEFSFEMPDDAANNVLTIGQVVDYIYKRKAL